MSILDEKSLSKDELAYLTEMMEKLAGEPSVRHIRQPGEKGMYERYNEEKFLRDKFEV